MKKETTLFVIIGTIVCAVAVQAQSTAWTNRSGGLWSEPLNWSPNEAPGPGTNAWLTNATANFSYVVTNDVADNRFGGLFIYNAAGNGNHTLLCAGNGFTAGGGGFIGRLGILTVTNTSASFAGSVTVSNTGAIYVRSNAFLNVGGTNAAEAMKSSVALTNLPGGYIELSQGGGNESNYFVGRIHASTAIVGVVNQGTIRSIQAHYVTGIVQAVIFNETNGLFYSGTLISGLALHRVPTNRGRLHVGNVTSWISITNGDVVNEGFILNENGGSFRILNGALINASNGVARLWNGGGALAALSTENHGLIVISNTQASSSHLDLGGPVANYGEMRLFRTMPAGGNTRYVFVASNVVNEGVIRAIGTYGTLYTNAIAGTMTVSPVTNRAAGLMISTGGCVFVLSNVRNEGRFEVCSNAVFAIGSYSVLPGRIRVGAQTFRNEGTIQLRGGDFGALLLTNAAGAVVRGEGALGMVALTNLVSSSAETTNFVRILTVRGLVNEGLLAPEGVLNAGAITNRAGGVIAGYGAIRSLDATNYYDGETLVVTNLDRQAPVHNEAGGVILADGGILTLENGFLGNVQYGVVGATNGGVLRIGAGSGALDNRGTIRLHGGRLECGDLTVTGGVVSIDLDTLASETGGLVQAAALTLGESSALTLTGSGKKAVLIRYTGTRAGAFATVTGIPPGARLYYGRETDGSLLLAPSGGAVILLR